MDDAFWITGVRAAGVFHLVTVAMAYCAWGAYRRKLPAWWGMLLLGIVGTLNMVVTAWRTDLLEMYEKMRMPAAQLELMRKSGMIDMMSRWMPWMGLVGGALWLGYLLYVRRYFAGNAAEPSADDRPPREA